MRRKLFGALGIGLALCTADAAAADSVLGPVAADVVDVIDGATIVVDAHTWPGVTVPARACSAARTRTRWRPCGRSTTIR